MNASSIILIIGLPGTGKTTFSKILATELKAYHLNSDMVRQEIGKKGQYDDASKAEVYEELLKRTSQYLKNQKTVILDATLYKKDLRKPYLALAKKYDVQHAGLSWRLKKKRLCKESTRTVPLVKPIMLFIKK